MQLFSVINSVFHCDDISISERMNTVEASLTIAIQHLPKVSEIQSICNLVPLRDKLTIVFKNDSDDILQVTNQQAEMPDFLALTDGMAQNDSIEVKIQIDKTVSANKFSIFNLKQFAGDLLHNSLTDILKWFSSLLASQEYLIFEVFDSDVSFSTATLAFVSSENSVFSSKIVRSQRLRVCKETAYFYNMSEFELIPEDFAIEGIEQSDNFFRSLFAKLSTILSLIYTVSSASITDTSLILQINGQRAMSHSFDLNDVGENLKWRSIYSWIFTDGNPTDKALIAHNVISLHCKYADFHLNR